ncbi:MAG: hemerythrin domain-containing protein [Roseobacter sp.]|nr:hemerythrin domain-containing protein [Roseobacter sp.]
MKQCERHKHSARGEKTGLRLCGNPLDEIAEDHMREREVCALLERLAEGQSLEAAEIEQMRDFLQLQLPHHIADEDIDLFPMMLKRCDPEDEIEKGIDRLQSDHGHALEEAAAVLALLQRSRPLGAGVSQAEIGQIKAFVSHSRRHLIFENAVILPIARVRLGKRDLRTMKRHMLERRGLDPDLESGKC